MSGNASASPSKRLAALSGGSDAAARPTVGALLDALGAEGPAPVLLLLALGALVPGAAPVFAFALMPVAIGLLLGRNHVAVPARLRTRAVSRRRVDGMARGLGRFERRFGALSAGETPGWSTRLVAFVLLFDAVLVVLPIPVGNVVPALAAVFLAATLAGGGRLALVAGLVLSVAAVFYEVALVWLGIGLVRAVIAML